MKYKLKEANINKLREYLEKKNEKPSKPKRRRNRTKQYNACYFFYARRAAFTNCSTNCIYYLYGRPLYYVAQGKE